MLTVVFALCMVGSGLPFRTATVDITPPESLPLGGYTERKGASFVPGDVRLFARTVMLGDVAIVSVETLTIPESLAEEVQKRVGATKVFLAASHTHCAPDSQMLNTRMTFPIPGIATYRRKWLDWYADKIASSITQAQGAQARPVAHWQWGAQSVSLNRGRRGGATPLTAANFLLADGAPLVVAYPAHPTLRDEKWLKLDGDWPGAVMRKTGGIVLLGPIGDASPVAEGKDSDAQIRAFAKTLLDATATCRRIDPLAKDSQAVRYVNQPVKLGAVTPHPGFAKSYRVPDSLAKLLVGKFAPSEAHLTCLFIGKVAIVGVPGEPTSAIARRIVVEAKKSGYVDALVVSHVNGWIGYILDPKEYDAGGYEATLSFHGREVGDRIVEAAAEAFRLKK